MQLKTKLRRRLYENDYYRNRKTEAFMHSNLQLKLWQFCHTDSRPKGKHAKFFLHQIEDAICNNPERFAFSLGWENAMQLYEYAQNIDAHDFAIKFECFMCKYQKMLDWVDKNK